MGRAGISLGGLLVVVAVVAGAIATGTTAGAEQSGSVQASLLAGHLDAGELHTCAVLDGGAVSCWGSNSNGQLGDGTTTNSSTPTAVDLPVGAQATAISTGGQFTCALLKDGSLTCWGTNTYGQLGNDTTTDSSTPVAVSLPSGTQATAISAGDFHACALLTDGSVTCWGQNIDGQLGNGTTTNSSTPVAVSFPAGTKATAISAGSEHTCALLSNGSLDCWGENTSGQLGNGTTTNSLVPVAVSLSAGRTAAAVSAGDFQACALLSDGSVTCWGQNVDGQLGNGTTTDDSSTPVAVSFPAGTKATAISAGSEHTCALLSNGSLDCWGENTSGQLGNGTTTDDSSTPVAVSLPAGRVAAAISVGGFHTCVLLEDGSVGCFGFNMYGQLGNGTTTNSPTLVFVGGLQGSITGREAQLNLTTGKPALTLSAKSPATLTLSLSNSGPNDDPATVVSLSLPPGVKVTDTTASAGSYDPSSSQWTVGSIAAGTHALLVLSLVATGTSSAPETLSAVVSHDSALDPSAVAWTPQGQGPGEHVAAKLLLPPTPKKPPVLGSSVVLGISANATAVSVKLACTTAACLGVIALRAQGQVLSRIAYRLKANQTGTFSLPLGKVGAGLRGSLAHQHKHLPVTLTFDPVHSHLLGALQRSLQI